jgi:hypothetical protein
MISNNTDPDSIPTLDDLRGQDLKDKNGKFMRILSHPLTLVLIAALLRRAT